MATSETGALLALRAITVRVIAASPSARWKLLLTSSLTSETLGSIVLSINVTVTGCVCTPPAVAVTSKLSATLLVTVVVKRPCSVVVPLSALIKAVSEVLSKLTGTFASGAFAASRATTVSVISSRPLAGCKLSLTLKLALDILGSTSISPNITVACVVSVPLLA